MEQVTYNGQECYVWARNGNYVTLKELSTEKYHLSIHKDLIHESSKKEEDVPSVL